MPYTLPNHRNFDQWLTELPNEDLQYFCDAIDPLAEDQVLAQETTAYLLTQELRKDIPQEAIAIQSEEEAHQAIADFSNASGETTTQLDVAEIMSDDTKSGALGREMLKLLLKDETTHAKAEEMVAKPPVDEQMSVELAVAGAVIIGTLVTWLQTKVKLKVSKKDGKTAFEFEMTKDAAGTEAIRELARSVMTLLRGF